MKKKILFILPSLAAGGAERVISFISQNLDRKAFDVSLLIISSKTSNSYELDDNLKTIYLDKKRVLNAIPLLFKSIAKIKPDIVVSSISHLNTVMAITSLFFRKTKFIAREATVTGKRVEDKSFKALFYSKLIKTTYPLLDRIICQSEDMKNDLISTFQIPEEKIVIINNPITNNIIEKNLKNKIEYTGPIKYITVGRLVDVKGHLRIIELLSKITFNYTYTIIGEGSLKDKIFNTIKNYGMNDKIIYIPYTKEVSKYLIQSDLFLQGSYVEGFPNAVLESCAVGTPVLAFNAPGGTKEIIENGVNGFIVSDAEGFLDKLNDKHEWDALQIKNSVYQKFGKKIIMDKYEILFQSI